MTTRRVSILLAIHLMLTAVLAALLAWTLNRQAKIVEAVDHIQVHLFSE